MYTQSARGLAVLGDGTRVDETTTLNYDHGFDFVQMNPDPDLLKFMEHSNK